ncbi:MAG: retropepsin-like aspartic protease [Marinifilaceae bacterium]
MRLNQLYRITILFTTGLILFGTPIYSQSPNEVIGKLVGGDDLFELQKQHRQLKDSIIPMLDYLSESVLATAFNQSEKGIKALDILLGSESFQQQLGPSNITNLTMLHANLCEDGYHYKEAAEVLQSFLEKTKSEDLGQMRPLIQQKLEINLILAEQAPMRVTRLSKDCEIRYNLENTGRGQSLFVEAKINGKALPMIFDTGCPKYNFISERVAKEFGITKLVDSIPLTGVGKGFAWIGIADSLSLGDVTCYNPLFYIAQETAADSVHGADAVLGADLFNALGEVQFYPEKKKIVFPVNLTALPASGHNMVMKNRQPYLKLNQKGKSMLMHFDTGNVKTYMTPLFYKANSSLVEELGVKDSLRIGGFGGVSVHKSYRLPFLSFELAGTNFKLPNLDVSTEGAMEMWCESGVLGVDFIQQFTRIIVSYKDMFVKIEN